MCFGHFFHCLGVGLGLLSGVLMVRAQDSIPPEAAALFQSAEQFQKAGQIEQAQADYQRIIESFPGTPLAAQAQAKIVCVRLEAGDLSGADAELETLFSVYSGQTEPFTRSIYPILNRYVYRKEYEKAVEAGRRALQLYPTHGHSFSTRAVMAEALVQLNRTGEADALVEEMFSLYRGREDFVPFVHTVKSAYWKAGQKEKSQVLCRRLLEEFPEHPMAARLWGDWICGAMVLGQEDGVEEAIETLLARPEPAEEFLSAVIRIQERSLAQNDYSRVLSVGTRALEKYPFRPERMWIYRYLAEASAGMQDASAAEQWARRLTQECGGQAEFGQAAVQTGHGLRRHGLYAAAAEVYGAVLGQGRNPAEELCALTGMAQSYIHLGEDGRVEQIVERIMTDYRGQEKLGYSVFVIGEEYLVQAELALQAGHQTEAEENYQRAERVWKINRYRIPEDPKHQAMATHFTGWTYHQCGDYKRAVELYEETLETWPSYEKAWQCAMVAVNCYEKLAIAGVLSRPEANAFIKKCYEQILNNPQSCPAPIQYRIRNQIEQIEQAGSPSENKK
ncbi:MAG TPA: tetratricopeptide repeat protein [Anaerohalosphaeraceae bacterium]|nr:tetratricopeptide repeat protein [Anaerohalosphaeraceae bacterium]